MKLGVHTREIFAERLRQIDSPLAFRMNDKVKGNDLTKQAPRSPKTRLGDYVILGRTLDKCRAQIAGDIGEYHFDCPLDNMLFGWKGTNANDFKAKVESGASDDEMAKFVDETGTPKSDEEKRQWGEQMLATNPYENPEKRDWYIDAIKSTGQDPKTTPLFDWLETDDKMSYAKAA